MYWDETTDQWQKRICRREFDAESWFGAVDFEVTSDCPAYARDGDDSASDLAAFTVCESQAPGIVGVR